MIEHVQHNKLNGRNEKALRMSFISGLSRTKEYNEDLVRFVLKEISSKEDGYLAMELATSEQFVPNCVKFIHACIQTKNFSALVWHDVAMLSY